MRSVNDTAEITSTVSQTAETISSVWLTPRKWFPRCQWHRRDHLHRVTLLKPSTRRHSRLRKPFKKFISMILLPRQIGNELWNGLISEMWSLRKPTEEKNGGQKALHTVFLSKLLMMCCESSAVSITPRKFKQLCKPVSSFKGKIRQKYFIGKYIDYYCKQGRTKFSISAVSLSLWKPNLPPIKANFSTNKVFMDEKNRGSKTLWDCPFSPLKLYPI
jgi:hypothetical protein